ncbi:uncharacterized protein LOC135149158 isoform X1 [Daucus carota subsp. sativus]|uniref:uncharacterized protein LOC135149158 isoform X1 n=1 Tax=Daucus carota subsp. sativus TaxID=79200 RepID=UPI0030835D44
MAEDNQGSRMKTKSESSSDKGKRRLEDEDNSGSYSKDLKRSQNFELGDYPEPWIHYPQYPGDRLQFCTGGSFVAKVYDISRSSKNCRPVELVQLLCYSRLAMALYNIRMGTNFSVVKVLMATAQNTPVYTKYVTFEAETNSGGSVTFQTKIIVFYHPCHQIQILFVRIKPDYNNSQPSDLDHIAVVEEGALLSRVISTYTTDSGLDSQYNLALYLSQFALVSHDVFVLKQFRVAKHDIESLKVLQLVKLDSSVPSYLITFEASLLAETDRKSVETFETKICMPTLFPTTTIELSSEARVITVGKSRVKGRKQTLIAAREDQGSGEEEK